jgi:hypothetical protein
MNQTPTRKKGPVPFIDLKCGLDESNPYKRNYLLNWDIFMFLFSRLDPIAFSSLAQARL